MNYSPKVRVQKRDASLDAEMTRPKQQTKKRSKMMITFLIYKNK